MTGLPTYPDCPIPREPPVPINLDKGTRDFNMFCLECFASANARLPTPYTYDKFLHYTIELGEKVGKDFRVLPLFEKFLFEYKYRKYYSLETNKLLHCRWRSYVKYYDEREFAPFTFVDIRDFHFYNGMLRLLPENSIHRTKEFPFKLRVGPGVDFRGQMPIPQDMMMKRGVSKPKAKVKINPKTTNEIQKEIKDKT